VSRITDVVAALSTLASVQAMTTFNAASSLQPLLRHPLHHLARRFSHKLKKPRANLMFGVEDLVVVQQEEASTALVL
jgi:hypothetical protein